MTIPEMREFFETREMESGTILCRFGDDRGSHNFAELDYRLVQDALTQIEFKLPAVVAGMDEFNAAEKFAFQLLVRAADCCVSPTPYYYKKKEAACQLPSESPARPPGRKRKPRS